MRKSNLLSIFILILAGMSVSYTHLDVYKRQVPDNSQVVVAGQSRLVNGMEVEVEASSQLSSK